MLGLPWISRCSFPYLDSITQKPINHSDKPSNCRGDIARKTPIHFPGTTFFHQISRITFFPSSTQTEASFALRLSSLSYLL